MSKEMETRQYNKVVGNLKGKQKHAIVMLEATVKSVKRGITFALGANLAIRAAAALPALFSSMKLMVEFISSKRTMPAKS